VAVASGRLRPEYRDAEELAQIAWASLHGLLALHIVKRKHGNINWRDARTTAGRMSAALLRGLLRNR
jgi:hypothetical protein